MRALEKRGWKWAGVISATQHSMYVHGLTENYSKGLIVCGGDKFLRWIMPPEHEGFEMIKNKAIKVELPRPKIVRETESVQTFLNRKAVNGRDLEFELSHVSTLAGAIAQSIADGTSTIKPSHYKSGSGDLFDDWFNRYDLATFRALMYGTAERYFRRYPDKNGKEDFKKGQEVLRRLEEYEAKAGEVKGWRK
jgi:hypothetical protein